MFRADLKRAGIAYRSAASDYADFHSLRHTYITRIVRVTQDLKMAQVLARHSTIQLTLNRYAHVWDDERHQAVNRLAVFTPTAVGAEGCESTQILPEKQPLHTPSSAESGATRPDAFAELAELVML